MRKKILRASVFTDASEIAQHLVGLKDVRVLSYARQGPVGEITIEQQVPALSCPRCRCRAWVKDRPVVSYVDLPFGGVPSTGSPARTADARRGHSPSLTTGSPPSRGRRPLPRREPGRTHLRAGRQATRGDDRPRRRGAQTAVARLLRPSRRRDPLPGRQGGGLTRIGHSQDASSWNDVAPPETARPAN